ncbi:TPA: hypothetical protein HLU76_24120, partial [Escherichia coli]|nr:hypothetical protein [Escherichia coli]
MSVKSTTAAATATTIITIPGTGWRTIALSNRALYCWKAATCMTRWAAASENGCGKAGGSAG